MCRVCMGRVCHVPSLLWTEFVMCRVDLLPFLRWTTSSPRVGGWIESGSSRPRVNSARVISAGSAWPRPYTQGRLIGVWFSHLSPLTSEVVGAPQMTLQQYLSTLPCLPLPSNPNPVHSLMLSSHLFFCLPLLLAPFTVPCRIVFAMPEDLEMWPYHLSFHFSPWLGDHHALQLHSEFCCEPPRSSHGLCRKCSEVSYSISSQELGSFSRFLLSKSSSHRHKGR